MDFDGALGGAVLGPVEDLGAEVDDGAVQPIELAGDQQGGLAWVGGLVRRWVSRFRNRSC